MYVCVFVSMYENVDKRARERDIENAVWYLWLNIACELWQWNGNCEWNDLR